MDDNLATLSDNFDEVFLSDHEIHLRSPFRFFDLPPELWLRISEYAVTSPAPIAIGKERRVQDQVAILRQPALARTCQLLRHEVLPMYYALNSFEVRHRWNIPCMRKWIVVVGDAARRRMRQLTMFSQSDREFWMGSFARAGIEVSVTRKGWVKDRMTVGVLNVYIIKFE